MNLKVFDLGLINYYPCWQFQKQVFRAVKAGLLDSALIFCSHRPVITFGKNADPKNLLIPKSCLEELEIKTYGIERGGDITYHGPGQLTAYPIINLNLLEKDIRWYLSKLEDCVISLLSEFGITAHSRSGLTGVWIDSRKIASCGIAIKNWITFHGISLNVKSNDLDNFKLIRPCGMEIEMVSLEDFSAREVSVDEIKPALVQKFSDTLKLKPTSGSWLKFIPSSARD